ncbi:MAG: hypothetical protein GXO27_06730 [Chlorobi bacterium]|nr:hypothetical protein [Chlorobiota bacterium]
MFGDLFNIKEKIEKAKQEVLDTRRRLDSVYVEKISPCGAVRVKVTANKQVEEIQLSDNIPEDREALSQILKETLNRALEEAGRIQEKELKDAFMKHMPSLPGLDGLL